MDHSLAVVGVVGRDAVQHTAALEAISTVGAGGRAASKDARG